VNDSIVKILEEKGIKPTATRILAFRSMLTFNRAFSLGDLEKELLSIDKSTISRIIHLFHDKQLIHNFDDGSGSVKYSVCQENCDCNTDDSHVHFYCNYCKKAFCLENILVPKFELPENMEIEGVNFVIKGYCGKCDKIAT
jgi:Fur family ferric uptake transcriptional regulator